MFKSSLRAEISNSVYSDVYVKVRQVFLETIIRGRDAVVVVPVGFMRDSYELWTSSRSYAEQFYNFRSDSHALIVVSPLNARDQVDPKKKT